MKTTKSLVGRVTSRGASPATTDNRRVGSRGASPATTDNRRVGSRGLQPSMLSVSRPASRPSSAFTLIELLAVILIISILLVIGMTSLPRMQQALALDVAAGQLVAAFELARQTALTRHTDAAVCMLESGYSVVIKNQYPISDYMLAGNSWQTNTFPSWIRDILYTIHPAFVAGLPRGLPAGVAISEKPPDSFCLVPTQQGRPLNADLTVWPWSKTVLPDESLFACRPNDTSANTINNPLRCAMAGFNSRGEASITCTVGLYAVTSSKIAPTSLTNMPNWVRVILTQGSGKIQVVRP